MKESHPWPRSILFTLGFLMILVGIGLFRLIEVTTDLSKISNKTASFSKIDVINSLDDISLEDQKLNLNGSPVLLRDVLVKEVLGNYLFMIGNKDVSIPVVLSGEITGRQQEEKVKIRAGDRLRLTGLLFSLEEPEDIIDPSFIDAKELKRIKNQAVYIYALRTKNLGREAQEE